MDRPKGRTKIRPVPDASPTPNRLHVADTAPLDAPDAEIDAEIDARIAAMEARLEEAKASRDEALRLRARVEREAAEFMSTLAEDGAADPRGGVATDVARKVLEAVGGGAELDELRGILEEDAGG